MSLRHSATLPCPLCTQKELELTPELRVWVRLVRAKYPTAHISWGFRGEKDQNDAFKRGASKLKWPASKHNKMKDGQPASEAVDFFELRDGKAFWERAFFQRIADEFKQPNIAWGGNWVTFKDFPHFEITKPKLTA